MNATYSYDSVYNAALVSRSDPMPGFPHSPVMPAAMGPSRQGDAPRRVLPQ